MTTLNRLNAISPIDGRETRLFRWLPFFSEEALIKYRVLVEIEYFIALCECLQLAGVQFSLFESLRNIYKNFSTEDALDQRNGKVTNHDVKAVEYLSKMLLKIRIIRDIKSLSTLD
jgi:adenylosuccinate lyase